MSISYKAFNERTPDLQYRDLLKAILEQGVITGSAHEERSKTLLAPTPMHFDLSNGVPLITERSFTGVYKSAIGELLAFINGVHTLEGLREFGVNDRFWDRWVTEKKCAKRGLPAGDLGPGSYGPAFHDFPSPEGPFNQISAVINQMREHPNLRTHRVVNWIPFYMFRGTGIVQKVVVTPCHGDMFFRIIDGSIHLVMIQHKADMVVGVPSNMIQYAALLIAIAHVLGLQAGTYRHVLIDAHMYLTEPDEGAINQETAIRMMLEREPFPYPILTLTENAPNDIFAFRTEHFVLSEYAAHPAIKNIGTAI